MLSMRQQPFWRLLSGQDCFEIRDSALLPSIGGTVTTAKHLRTGADLVHVSCAEDPENYFGICFRTIPEDDTGILHMLEHMVLEGSDKYPIRHGFKEIHKRSIATMLSAFTGGDRTVYHCGSLYQEDYFNLISYLMDAVFHPLLGRDAFLQEGYRLDLAIPGDISSELIHTGVVYNEMKGVEGWPDGQMAREIDRRLYPRGTYGFCAAGCSASIPGSTRERILAAHRRFYQPVNSCLFLFTQQPFGRMADFLGSSEICVHG